MTFKNFGKLPGKPSALIRLALADLAKVRKDPRYKVDMTGWHYKAASKCHVCAAGAVMAKTLKKNINRKFDARNFGEESEALVAIDNMRRGWVGIALAFLGLPNGGKFSRTMSCKFKRSEMLKLAKDLEKAGY